MQVGGRRFFASVQRLSFSAALPLTGRRGIIRSAQNIVCAGVVKFRKPDNKLSGNSPFARFIIAVYSLINAQNLGYLLLRQIIIVT